MKPVRRLLFFLAGGATLVLVLVALGFTSAFQTWAARKALSSQPALRASVGRVSAGLGRIELEAVHAESDGAVLTLPALTAELPLWSAAVSHDVAVTKLIAKGWILDLSQAVPASVLPSPAPGAAVPATAKTALAKPAISGPNPAEAVVGATAAAFKGVFAQLRLPVDLSVDGLELEGDVLLPPAPGAPSAKAHIRIVGGGLSVGREGRFTVDLSVALVGANIPVAALTAHATFIAAMDTPRTFTRFEAETSATARGEKFPQGLKLTATFGATRAPLVENYAAVFVLEGKELVAVRAEFPRDGHILSGTWKLNARTTDLAPFSIGRALPEIEAVGQGKFTTDAAFAEIQASGQLDATAAQLAVIKPELAALGTVKVTAEFDLAQQGGALRVDRLTAQFSAARPVAAIKSLQPFAFNATTGELKVADPSRELLALDLQGVPLAWVQPFIKNFKLSGGDLHGELVATASNGGLALRSKGPVTLAAVGLASSQGALLKALDVTLGFSADYTPQGWQAAIAPLSISSGGAQLLTLSAKAGQLTGKDQPIKATGLWSGNLPALLAQPAAGQVKLTQGEASGEFVATLAGKKEIQATLLIKNLVADPKLTKAALPSIAADVRVDVDAAGKINFNAPFLFERGGRKSDLALIGTALPGPTMTVFDVRVVSAVLVVDDLQVLAALAPGGPPAEEAVTKPVVATKDEKPFWAGLSGQFVLGLKKVVYSEKFEVNDVGGTLRLADGALKLTGVRADFGEEGAFKLTGDVTFLPDTREPYALQADVALNNFDSAPLFRALDPARLPAVEGRFNIVTHLVGSGVNVGQLAARTRGEVQLTSKSGLFRGLSADMADSLRQAPSMLSGAVSSVGALLGRRKDKPDDVTEFLDKQGKVVVELADRLKEISYDQINVVANRDEKLNIKLKEFSLISPEVRLRGTGQITYREGVPTLGQPLDLNLQIGARGRLENLMNSVTLLDGRQDELGYNSMSEPVYLGGTLENIDQSALKKILIEAALRKAKSSLLENLGGLLGR